jgi:hypothetical protein
VHLEETLTDGGDMLGDLSRLIVGDLLQHAQHTVSGDRRVSRDEC